MAVKVLIKRRFDPDKIAQATKILIRIRYEAMKRDGYISSETWRRLDDTSRIAVVSMWETPEAWNTWYKSPERGAFSEELKAVMTEAEAIEPYALGIPYQG